MIVGDREWAREVVLGGNISQFSLRSQQPGRGLSLQTGGMRADDCGAAVAVERQAGGVASGRG